METKNLKEGSACEVVVFATGVWVPAVVLFIWNDGEYYEVGGPAFGGRSFTVISELIRPPTAYPPNYCARWILFWRKRTIKPFTQYREPA